MHAIGLELLKGTSRSLKFILNDSAIIFFPGNQQHRDVKIEGVSYEDEYRGNAVAGLVAPDRVEIRFHSAFSEERLRNIWARVVAIPEVASAGLGSVYYQGRKIQ
jgi:hypothetical protein